MTQHFSATYDPADNKLRLRSISRLDKELYQRVRASGFIWAPKQDLFVAPKWTPEREDLLLELCDEIGDEDTSLVERAEQRAERFEDYSDSRAEDADRAHSQVAGICERIPLGQPILIAHHSERHARRDAEKIENGMRKAVKMWETSKYWESRARGALMHAKYLERPDVRARRIKGIEADKRKMEKQKTQAEAALRFWSGKFNLRNTNTGEVKPLEITEENRERICNFLGSSYGFGVCFNRPGEDSKGYWSSWDVLRPDGERYAACPSKTVAECQEVALKAWPKQIERYDRWIAHYDNRLMYERLMLIESGGTATDKVGPEKGGACKCWSSKGDYSVIQKVNKISVTVMRNWGNGGEDFPHTVEFDKLSSLKTKAEVDKVRLDHQIDPKLNRIPSCFFECDLPTAKPSAEKSESDKAFEALRDAAMAGVQVVVANQLFPTPSHIAKQLVEMVDIWGVSRVLEPSAGTGNLIDACIGKVAKPVVAVEINIKLANSLREKWPGIDVRCADFLTCNGDLGKFDRIIMNPPFSNGADIKHILHAMTFLAPGGKLAAICANGPRQQEQLKPMSDEWIELPDGTFSEQGTEVRTAMLLITKN